MQSPWVNGVDPSGKFDVISTLAVGAIGQYLQGTKAAADLGAKGFILRRLANVLTNSLAQAIIAIPELYLYFSFALDVFHGIERATLTGNGGKDITKSLLKTTKSINQWWAGLTPEGKQDAFNSIHNIGGWDATPLPNSISDAVADTDQEREFGVPGWAGRTVTVAGNVYFAQEVNYFYFGYLYSLAQKSGLSADYISIRSWVYGYRAIFNPIFVNKPLDGSIAGRADWASAGFNLGADGVFEPPLSVRIPKAVPSAIIYNGFVNGEFQINIDKNPIN